MQADFWLATPGKTQKRTIEKKGRKCIILDINQALENVRIILLAPISKHYATRFSDPVINRLQYNSNNRVLLCLLEE